MFTANLFKLAFNRSKSKSNNANAFLLKTTAFASIASLVGAFSTLDHEYPTVGKSFNAKEEDPPAKPSVYNITNPFSQRFLAPNLTLCAASIQPAVDQREVFTNDLGAEDPTTYYFEKMADPPQKFAESHAIFGGLRKPGHIERYNFYRRVTLSEEGNDESVSTVYQEVCVADIRIGKYLNGHDKIVHGGIISLMIDDTFGWGYEALSLAQGKSYGDKDFPMVVTANLTVNYRAPLPAGSDIVIRVRHENTDGRKIYMSARMESHDGNIIYSEATALFITVAKQHLTSTNAP